MAKRSQAHASVTTVRRVQASKRSLYAAVLPALVAFAYNRETHESRRTLDQGLPVAARLGGLKFLDMYRVRGGLGLQDVLPDARENVQRELRESLERLLSPGTRYWSLPPAVGALQVDRIYVERVGMKGREFLATWEGPWPASFWFTVATVLEHGADLLRRCARPDCATVFVRTRRQNYCSMKCSQRVRSRKNYGLRREEILEARHRAYVRQQKKAHPNAKVARRKRS